MSDDPEKLSVFEQIKRGLEELLDATQKGEVEKRFKITQVRKTETEDGRQIITRVSHDPKAGGDKVE